MTYFDYFCNKNKEVDVIKGTCKDMCPTEEVKMREKEDIVHILEVMGMEHKLVKCYSRSAADSNMAKPSILRPYDVLKDTVWYLLFEITRRKDVSELLIYDFLNDRLRAVRQDMTIQRLPPEECASLLELMVRFYVYYGYKLCELQFKDYDPVLNKKYLLECLKWILTCFDTVTPQGTDQDLCNCFKQLDLNKRNQLTCDRILMERLYILCNLDDIHPLYRYLNLPKILKSEPTLRMAYKLAVANMRGDYIKVCKLLDKLCPLSYCALCLHLPVLQRRALQVMSHAYNSQSLTVPCKALCYWLRFESDADAIAACAHYGINTKLDAIKFSKAGFCTDAPTLPPKKLLTVGHLDLSNDYVFTYN